MIGFRDDNLEIQNILNIIAYIIFGIYLTIVIILCVKVIRELKRLEHKLSIFIEGKKFKEAIDYLNIQLHKYNWGSLALRTKYYLVLLNLEVENNETAKDLTFNIKWRVYNNFLWYIRFLFALRDKDLNNAYIYFNKIKKNKKFYKRHLETSYRLIKYIESKEDDKTLLDSSLPIVGEIYFLYQND